jgi:hypothetical protein
MKNTICFALNSEDENNFVNMIEKNDTSFSVFKFYNKNSETFCKD